MNMDKNVMNELVESLDKLMLIEKKLMSDLIVRYRNFPQSYLKTSDAIDLHDQICSKEVLCEELEIISSRLKELVRIHNFTI